MSKYFYTFGTDEKFPYQGGWVEVWADNWNEAHMRFRTRFPNRRENVLNCAFFYSEEEFGKSTMTNGNMGEYCHEIIE